MMLIILIHCICFVDWDSPLHGNTGMNARIDMPMNAFLSG